MSEKVARFFLSFAVTLLIARYLLPAQFGIFSSFLAVIAMLAPITQMGLSGILIQHLVKSKNDRDAIDSILQNAGALRLIGGVSIFFILFIPSLFIIDRAYEFRVELSLLFAANALSCLSVYEAYFKSIRYDKINAVIQTSVLAVSALLKILCVFFISTNTTLLSSLLVITAIELSLTPVATFLFWRRKYPIDYVNRLSPSSIRGLWKDCRWLLLSGAAAVLYIKTDIVMVIWLLDDYSAGIYGAASRFTEVWFFLAPLLMNVFLPKLQHQFQENYEQFKRLVRWLSLVMLLFSTGIAILMVMFSDSLISIALGDAFYASKTVIVWHIWLLPLVFFRAVISTWLIINEHYRFSLISHSLGALTNIVLNVLLIPAFGLLGAVAASWCAFFVATFLAMFMSASTRAFFTDLISSPSRNY